MGAIVGWHVLNAWCLNYSNLFKEFLLCYLYQQLLKIPVVIITKIFTVGKNKSLYTIATSYKLPTKEMSMMSSRKQANSQQCGCAEEVSEPTLFSVQSEVVGSTKDVQVWEVPWVFWRNSLCVRCARQQIVHLIAIQRDNLEGMGLRHGVTQSQQCCSLYMG